MKNTHFWRNLCKIITPLLLGILINFFIKNSISHYDIFIKPALAPPKMIFPIIWTILYLCIGFSYYFVTKNNPSTPLLHQTYFAHLFMNYLWPILFFFLGNLWLSIFILIFLIISSIYLFRLFYKQDKTFSFLLIPYILWFIFALYLNVSIYALNV